MQVWTDRATFRFDNAAAITPTSLFEDFDEPTVLATRARKVVDFIAPREKTVSELLDLAYTAGSDDTPPRKIQSRLERKRSGVFRDTLIQIYGHTCLFCGGSTQVGINPAAYYVEAAHIKPLGMNGPNKIENFMLLCVDCHKQFDYGMLSLVPDGDSFRIVSKIDDDPLHGKVLVLLHGLDPDCVSFQYERFL